jgi:hypothetical protein
MRRAPIGDGPDGWQVPLQTALLEADHSDSRQWLLRVADANGNEIPLRVPSERRGSLPFEAHMSTHPVQIRLNDSGAPALWVGHENGQSRWRQLRKVQRSTQVH